MTQITRGTSMSARPDCPPNHLSKLMYINVYINYKINTYFDPQTILSDIYSDIKSNNLHLKGVEKYRKLSQHIERHNPRVNQHLFHETHPCSKANFSCQTTQLLKVSILSEQLPIQWIYSVYLACCTFKSSW